MSDVNFTPNRGAYKELTPFRYWCQKVLPLVYDDSISYYELLCKVVNYLNITMEDVSTLNDDVTAMYTAYNELQDFVNQYFTDLNVQTQIDNKLDRMAADGSLNALIDPLVIDTTETSVANTLPGVVYDQLPDVVEDQIDNVVGEQIDGVVADQIQGAADNWLGTHISGSNALDSTLTLYNAAARSMSAGNLIDTYAKYLGAENRITAFATGYWENDNGVMVHPSEPNMAYMSAAITVNPGDKYTIIAPAFIDVYSYVPRYAFTDSSYNVISVSDAAEQGAINKTITAPAGATKLIVNDNLVVDPNVDTRFSKMILVKGELTGTAEISDLKADLSDLTTVTSDNIESIKQHIETGKNLLPFETITKTINNLSVSYENGKIIRNGTAGSGEVYSLLTETPIALFPGTYQFWSLSSVTNTFYLTNDDATVYFWANRTGFTITEPMILYLGVRIAANWTGTTTNSIMLEKGAATTAYEPVISGTAIDTYARQMAEQLSVGEINYTCERTPQMYNGSGALQNETAQLHFYKAVIPVGTKTITYNSEYAGATPSHWYNEYDASDNLLYAGTLNISGVTKSTITIQNPDTVAYIKLSMWVDQGELTLNNSVKSMLIPPKFNLISALGDSITYGYSSEGIVTNTYQKMIADTLDAGFQNLGIASTPVCPNSDYTGSQNANAFVYRYNTISANADMIIIAGGTNDFRHNVPLGSETDTDAKYEETFYGACDYLLKNIIANHVSAKVVWVTPFHQVNDGSANTAGHMLTDYITAIKKKCEKYGVNCIDGFAISGINISVSAFVTACIPDSIHPNAEGHKLIYKNLMPYFAML